jgi:hypothetical protein
VHAVTRSSQVDGLLSLSAAELEHAEQVTSGEIIHEYPQSLVATAALSSSRMELVPTSPGDPRARNYSHYSSHQKPDLVERPRSATPNGLEEYPSPSLAASALDDSKARRPGACANAHPVSVYL